MGKKFQRFAHAGAVLAPGDIATGIPHGVLYLIDRVGRTGRHGCYRAVQHRDIVVMVTRGENIFARHFDQARQLGQRRAFVVIGVAKTQIYRVALVVELRMIRARVFDELGNPVHLFVTAGDQAFQALGLIDQTRFCLLIHKIDHLGEDRLGQLKEFSVLAITALIPIAKRFPFLAV